MIKMTEDMLAVSIATCSIPIPIESFNAENLEKLIRKQIKTKENVSTLSIRLTESSSCASEWGSSIYSHARRTMFTRSKLIERFPQYAHEFQNLTSFKILGSSTLRMDMDDELIKKYMQCDKDERIKFLQNRSEEVAKLPPLSTGKEIQSKMNDKELFAEEGTRLWIFFKLPEEIGLARRLKSDAEITSTSTDEGIVDVPFNPKAVIEIVHVELRGESEIQREINSWKHQEQQQKESDEYRFRLR